MNLFKNEPQHNKFYLPNANQKTILIYFILIMFNNIIII